ncbi:hypothetical protein NDU88_003013 [Pleurodeles waltl]|uniref:Uncharacterized protein n=1 Tax=Pleurodeles waltl TaxID=8319 RepID=A0AAV7MPL6_PLEWA|nr:hypothetical protein NDU88_003013 [Pleurodeles waltl]
MRGLLPPRQQWRQCATGTVRSAIYQEAQILPASPSGVLPHKAHPPGRTNKTGASRRALPRSTGQRAPSQDQTQALPSTQFHLASSGTRTQLAQQSRLQSGPGRWGPAGESRSHLLQRHSPCVRGPASRAVPAAASPVRDAIRLQGAAASPPSRGATTSLLPPLPDPGVHLRAGGQRQKRGVE